MKASGVDGLSRGDLTEGMMGGHNPLSFTPFHKGWTNNQMARPAWVQSWWLSKKGTEFQGLPLGQVTKENMFKLRDFKAARLWMLPLSAMEVAMKLL
jgi:hypothetical protein